MDSRPTVLSLCAGIGGIDLGLRTCGFRTVGYVERDAYAASVLVARMEDSRLDQAPIWSDLSTFDARAWRGKVDLVAAGYPCQPFSFAGNRAGADDERHLWPHVLRILVESEASMLFCENVAGHLSLGFSDVLSDLAESGFDAEWDLFRASDVGAPHRRERLFFLAYREGADRRLSVQFRGSCEAGAESRGRGEGVGDAEGEGRQPLTGGASCLESSHGREPCIVSPGNGSDVGNPTNERHERTRAAWGRCAGSADAGRHAWPPGPEDREGWARYIAEGGPEPVVRRGSDGPSSRLDRLRCLGNAVVPQVARVAFETLSQRAFR